MQAVQINKVKIDYEESGKIILPDEEPKPFYKKINWAFLFGLIGIVGVIFTVYSTLHEKKPNLSFEITNKTNVLDVHKPIKDLTILFQEKNIQEKNLNLLIYTIRIENIGEIDILQNHYDQSDVWGFQVQNGTIINVNLMKNNTSGYLKSKLNPQLAEKNTVEFNKVIFEREKFCTIEILVLHKKDITPEIIPIGKIAGIDKIIPIKTWESKDKRTIVAEVLSGTVLVHSIRFAALCILSVLSVMFMYFIGEQFDVLKDKMEKTLRRKKIASLWGKTIKKDKSTKNILIKDYIQNGTLYLETLQTSLEDEDKLLKQIQLNNLTKEYHKHRSELGPDDRRPLPREERWATYWVEGKISHLLDMNILSIGKDNKIVIDTKFKRNLDELLEYVEPPKTK